MPGSAITEQELMIVGAICARGGSKGVPRKNLRPLAGLPLIAHTIRCAQACPVFERIVVSTDDHEIMEVAKQYGAEAPFVRPAHLAQDDTSKWLVFRHLVETLEQMTGHRIDVLVDLDTGVPLRQPSDIVGCVDNCSPGRPKSLGQPMRPSVILTLTWLRSMPTALRRSPTASQADCVPPGGAVGI